MRSCSICEKKISCLCDKQENTKLKYRNCYMNIYDEKYPQIHLNINNTECHLCSLKCRDIFILTKLEQLRLRYDFFKI